MQPYDPKRLKPTPSNQELLEINSLGLYLETLAGLARCHSAEAFAEALYHGQGDGDVVTETRNVQRWYNGDAKPSAKSMSLIIDFFEKNGIIGRNINRELRVHLELLRATKKENAPRKRKIASENPTDSNSELNNERYNLFQLLDLEKNYDIANLLSSHPHNKSTTFTLKEMINMRTPRDGGRFQETIATIIIEREISPIEQKVASICANGLATADRLQISDYHISKLEEYFEATFPKHSSLGLTTLSTLAFALARSERYGPLRKIVALFFNDNEFGDHDFDNISAYYGSDLMQLMSIHNHFQERKRKGLMMAHDTHRLMRLKDRLEGAARQEALKLLRRSGAFMLEGGLESEGLQVLRTTSP